MRRYAIGFLLGLALPAAAEFGWTDTEKLSECRDAAKAILAEIKGLRQELKQYYQQQWKR